MPRHRIQRVTVISFSLAAAALAATSTSAASQDPSGLSSLRPDPGTVRILSRTGPRIRIENRRWVSGTTIQFTNDVTIRITDMSPQTSGAVITQGDVEPNDRLEVRAVSVQVAPVHVGGVLPPLLRGMLRDLTEQLPIVLIEEGQNFPADLSFVVVDDRLQVLSRDGSLRHQFRLGTGVEARVRALLLREVALRQLSVLDNPLVPFGVNVVVEGEPVRSSDGSWFEGVAVGRELRVRVSSEQSGYLTLLNLSPDGSVDLLTPNLYGQTFVRGGTEVVVPDPRSGLAFRMEYPTGIGLLRALVTPAPLRFEEDPSGTDLPDAAAFFAELEEQLGVFLQDSRIRIEYDRSTDWGSALTLYQVFDPY